MGRAPSNREHLIATTGDNGNIEPDSARMRSPSTFYFSSMSNERATYSQLLRLLNDLYLGPSLFALHSPVGPRGTNTNIPGSPSKATSHSVLERFGIPLIVEAKGSM